MVEFGLNECIANLMPVTFKANNDEITLKIESAYIEKPKVPFTCINVKETNVYPTECRQRADTYKGMLNATIGWSVNGVKKQSVGRELGGIPIMIKVRIATMYKKIQLFHKIYSSHRFVI